MTKTKKNTILMQGTILACAGLITKIIGFLYRIPMSNMLGEEGNGIYSIAFSIYNVALTLSSYSLPLAVSKLISTRLAKGEYKNAGKVFHDAIIFALVSGAIAMIVLFAGADFFESIYKCEGLAKPLMVLAPTTFVVALLGAFRGYFQGHSTMVPTAISQIAEQVINAVVSIAATYGFMKVYAKSDAAAAYGAAGGTLGTLSGAAIALLYFIILFIFSKTVRHEDNDSAEESNAAIYKALFFTIIPVIISQTIYQIGYTLDSLIFGNIMALKSFESTVVTSLQGVYNTQYNQLINLPVAIATAMASSTIPSIVSSKVLGKDDEVKAKITSVVKINMIIAFPAAVGLSVLASPVMQFLFPALVTYRQVASDLLMYGSVAIVFYAFSTITTAILQGNDYMKIPVIHCGISLVIHIAIISLLLMYTDLNIYALIIGNVTFPLVVSVLNGFSIYKKLNYKWEYKNIFIVPAVCSAVMGIFTYLSYMLASSITCNVYVSTIFSIIVSLVAYSALIIKSPALTKAEILDLPFGKKLIKFK